MINAPCDHCGAPAGKMCLSSCSHLWWPWVLALLAQAGKLGEAREKAKQR